MRRLSLIILAGAVSLLTLLPAAEQAPSGTSLAVETVGDRHYFHVRFDRPAGLFRAGRATAGRWDAVAPDPTPRLVPEGDAARLVCLRFRKDGIHTTLTVRRGRNAGLPGRTTPDEVADRVANLTAALQGPDRAERRRAAVALGQLGPKAATSVPGLRVAPFDFAEEVRTDASAALALIARGCRSRKPATGRRSACGSRLFPCR